MHVVISSSNTRGDTKVSALLRARENLSSERGAFSVAAALSSSNHFLIITFFLSSLSLLRDKRLPTWENHLRKGFPLVCFLLRRGGPGSANG